MIYFDAHIVPDLAKGALLSWLFCPFDFPFIFEHKMFQVFTGPQGRMFKCWPINSSFKKTPLWVNQNLVIG